MGEAFHFDPVADIERAIAYDRRIDCYGVTTDDPLVAGHAVDNPDEGNRHGDRFCTRRGFRGGRAGGCCTAGAQQQGGDGQDKGKETNVFHDMPLVIGFDYSYLSRAGVPPQSALVATPGAGSSTGIKTLVLSGIHPLVIRNGGRVHYNEGATLPGCRTP